jgi:tRNA(fMet)-specific endonuclease VapC
MTAQFLLDTNIISYAVKDHPAVSRRLEQIAVSSLRISAITEGEILFGLRRRPEATTLAKAMTEFLNRVEVLPWDRKVAARYGDARARLEAAGTPLAALDCLIAAHALQSGLILVTADRDFRHVEDLVVEDWTR